MGGKWETKCDARKGFNVRQAVLAGLYIIPLKFLQEWWFKNQHFRYAPLLSTFNSSTKATVDLVCIQFWQPALSLSSSKQCLLHYKFARMAILARKPALATSQRHCRTKQIKYSAAMTRPSLLTQRLSIKGVTLHTKMTQPALKARSREDSGDGLS